jgi:hypothetical protein
LFGLCTQGGAASPLTLGFGIKPLRGKSSSSAFNNLRNVQSLFHKEDTQSRENGFSFETLGSQWKDEFYQDGP